MTQAMAVKPDDVASIIYTSGTTGVPKGAMPTHWNFVSNSLALDAVVDFNHTDTVLSFLPLSHVLERMTTFSFLYKGASIAYAESVDTVAENLLEGYGLTETSPVLACNTFDKLRFGTVGPPVPGVEIKIAPDGEILARGPNIVKGYYKKDAETREALEGGWFHTGDIGHLDPDGFLVITDRKKDLIITASGKNVAPQPIENLLKTNPYILNAVVIGGNRKFISVHLSTRRA